MSVEKLLEGYYFRRGIDYLSSYSLVLEHGGRRQNIFNPYNGPYGNQANSLFKMLFYIQHLLHCLYELSQFLNSFQLVKTLRGKSEQ